MKRFTALNEANLQWTLQSDTRIVYHGWNMIAEMEPSRGTEVRQPADAGGCPAGVRQRAELPKQHQPPGQSVGDTPLGEGAWGKSFVRRSYLWGEDLAGSVGGGNDSTGPGAGGVGGLLAMTRHDRGAREAESYWVTPDFLWQLCSQFNAIVGSRRLTESELIGKVWTHKAIQQTAFVEQTFEIPWIEVLGTQAFARYGFSGKEPSEVTAEVRQGLRLVMPPGKVNTKRLVWTWPE